MTTFLKKSIIFAALLAAVTFAASAYNGTITLNQELGTFSRKQFDSEVATDGFDQTVYKFLSNYVASDGGRIDTCFVIYADNLDAEDSDLTDATMDWLVNNCRIKNGSTFMTIIVRGETDTGVDGWCVVSNFVNDCSQVTYYFNAAY